VPHFMVYGTIETDTFTTEFSIQFYHKVAIILTYLADNEQIYIKSCSVKDYEQRLGIEPRNLCQSRDFTFTGVTFNYTNTVI
jgi:hypothetical protein